MLFRGKDIGLFSKPVLAPKKGYDRGDPDTSINFLRYTAYFDKDEWQKEVIRLTEANHKAYTKVDFVAMEVQPAVVNTTVAVSVESLK